MVLETPPIAPKPTSPQAVPTRAAQAPTAADPLGSRVAQEGQAPARTERSAAMRSVYSALGAWPFILIHLSLIAVIWTGARPIDFIVCAALYVTRMFAVTGFYHRYFSHRTFKTSRVGQFCFACLAQTSAQRGALWWAAHHRYHHKYSDTEHDLHSPQQRGFWYAHVGWIFDRNDETQLKRVPDLSRYPELVWLDRYFLVPAILLGFVVFWWLGASGLIVGFMLSTVLVWHGTFTINSLTHIYGKRRFETTDDSRNNWLLALITLGEGWHNNHHHYQTSTRQGFYWWEIDITYYGLKALSWLRVIWDVREPSERVLEEGRAADRERRLERKGDAA